MIQKANWSGRTCKPRVPRTDSRSTETGGRTITEGTPTNAQLLSYMINGDPARGITGLKDMPGTVGYYAADDSEYTECDEPGRPTCKFLSRNSTQYSIQTPTTNSW